MKKCFNFKLRGRLEVGGRDDDVGQFSPDLEIAHSGDVKRDSSAVWCATYH